MYMFNYKSREICPLNHRGQYRYFVESVTSPDEEVYTISNYAPR